MNTLSHNVPNKSIGGTFRSRSVFVILILMALSYVGPAQAQETTGAPLAASCFEVISSETTTNDERDALIKLKGKMFGTSTEGELLVLVSPVCLAEEPVVGDPIGSDTAEEPVVGEPIGGDTAAAREAIDKIVSELIAKGADKNAVMDGADKIRNFVDKYENRGDVTRPLAEAAEQTSGGKEAAMIAAMVAMCLGLSAGLACTVPAVLSGLLLLGTDISDEDFQTGIRIMTKVATGQALDTTDYRVLAARGVPPWVQGNIRMTPSSSVGGYIGTDVVNAVESKTVHSAMVKLAKLADGKDSITCNDVDYSTGRKQISVDVNIRKEIDSMLLPASRPKSRKEAKDFLDCLDRAFPTE